MATAENDISYEMSHQYLQSDLPSKYRDLVLALKNTEEYLLKAIHEVFQSGRYKGKRIVEVGCGPTIHKLATPSRYYDEIITSDYAPKNIESVKKWVDGDPDALDWTPMLEIVAASEGHSDLASGVKEIEGRIRQKVKAVVHCDVLRESIFDPQIEEADLLITAGCLEGVCPSREVFTMAFRKLANLVKPDGIIVMVTALGMSFAEFDKKEIKALNVDEEFIRGTIEEAGLVQEHRFFAANDSDLAEYEGTLLVVARKL